MIKLFRISIIGILSICLWTTLFAKTPVQVDILYMDHGPMQPTLRELRALFPEYGDRLTVNWYNSESADGERFKAKKGIRHHTPLVIWLDGRSEVVSNGRTITFEGFPTGSGPSFFQGKWTLDDLAGVLDRMTGKY